MSERRQITHMQVRMARIAVEKWNLTIGEVAELFARLGVFEYIRDCFGIFCVEGDEAVWEELLPYMRARGCAYG